MRTVTIFGGSGFVGRYIVQKFAARGDFIRVAVRNPVSAQFLKPLGDVGQITPVQASLQSSEDISAAVQGADIVINLVGILYEREAQTFEALHVDGAGNLAKNASKYGVSTFLHMSALGANKRAPSRYASSKAQGEEAVLKHFPQAIIFRPSVVFGPEDSFLNRFAGMARLSPFLPLIGGGRTRFQPIYVGDVAESFLKASLRENTHGNIYELGGPAIYTFKELMEYLLKTIKRKRFLLPLSFRVAKQIATVTQFLTSPPLTPDQVELLKTDTVVSALALKAEDLGVHPQALEALIPLYLARYCPGGKVS